MTMRSNMNTRTQRRCWLVAAVFAIAITLAQFFLKNPAAIAAYFCAWWFWLGISLGSCAHIWVFTFTGGRWGETLEPLLQTAAAQMPLLALLYLPLLIAGNHYLYPWMPQAYDKSWWLNSAFFNMRSVIYLALWIVLALALERRRGNRRIAATGLLLYGFSISFAAFDWIMSLLPQWYATGFGLLAASGQLLSSFAFGVAAYLKFSQMNFSRSDSSNHLDFSHAHDRARLSTELQRDFGNLLLTYVLLWAYLAYTQFLIIWAENLPHEIAWYLPRAHGFWLAVGLGLITLHFALPLPILLLRSVKENSRQLFALALLLLVAHAIDSAWLVLPSLSQTAVSQTNYFSLALALLFVAMIGALWLWRWRNHLQEMVRYEFHG